MQKTQIIFKQKPTAEEMSELMELMPHLDITLTHYEVENLQSILNPLYKIKTLDWAWFRSLFNSTNDVSALMLSLGDLDDIGISDHWGLYSIDSDTKHQFYLTYVKTLDKRAKANGFKSSFAWMFCHEYLHGSVFGNTRNPLLATSLVHQWEAEGVLKEKIAEDVALYYSREKQVTFLQSFLLKLKQLTMNPTYIDPLPGLPISQKFGERNPKLYPRTRHHVGLDVATPKNTLILAPADGSVSDCGYDKTRGYWCEFQTNGLFWYFFHLSMLPTKKDVKQGKPIGFTGNTGTSTGYHNHREIWRQKRDVSLLTEQNFRNYVIDPETLI